MYYLLLQPKEWHCSLNTSNANSANREASVPRKIWRKGMNRREWSSLTQHDNSDNRNRFKFKYHRAVCPSHDQRLEIYMMLMSLEANARLRGHTRPHSSPSLNYFVDIW
jgi:hypothetical protein